jgi:hypothetical protein
LEQNGTNIHQKVYFIEENDGHQISINFFLQKDGESYWLAYLRFREIINLVPNHGFAEFAIIEFFYSGLNNEIKLMMDACAGGSLSNLTLKDCEDLFAKRAFNDEQYNPTTNIKQVNGMYPNI